MGKSEKERSSLPDDKNKLTNLPEDVLVEILVRLPVKLLLLFRCVCRSWNHLIRSPYFIKMHMKHQPECILIKRVRTDCRSILTLHSYESLNVISPLIEVPHFNKDDFKVSMPCNGLLLCVSSSTISTTSTSVLCNPATRECKLLPTSPFHISGWYINVKSIGLGFDSDKNDYKVVLFVKETKKKYNNVLMDKIDNNIEINKVEVYNLSSNSWRQMHLNMPCMHNVVFHDQGVQFNGALHWIGYYRNYIGSIFSFDVKTEVIQEIKLPKAICGSQMVKTRTIFTILNDSLGVIAFTPRYDSHVPKLVEIWVMKEYGVVESWTKQVSFSGHNKTCVRFYPRLLWKNEAILVEIIDSDASIDRYDIIDRRLQSCSLDNNEVIETGIISYGSESLGVLVYKESLVSLK